MPTIGTQPSLKRTQAVAAVLLHQFASDRFAMAGADPNLIRQAEDREHLNDLARVLLSENGTKCNDTAKPTTPVAATTTPNSDQDRSDDDDLSILNAASTTTNTSSPNSTLNGMEEHFHSIAESSLNNADRTLYHSMMAQNQSATSGSASSSSSTLDQLQSSPCLAAYGRELRRMAEEFERSRLRQDVKKRAEEIQLSELTREGFVQLLEELFQGEGGTREKIVTLFFFSTDVALRAASFAQDLVVILMGWSFSYIINTVCSLVHKLGGWDKVLFYQLPSVLISCCAVLAICSMVVFLKRSLLTSTTTT